MAGRTTVEPSPGKGRTAATGPLGNVRRILSALWVQTRSLLRVMRANPLTLAGFVLVVIIVVTAALVAILPPLTQLVLGHPVSILPYGPNDITGDIFFSPSFSHLLGTDELGRDMFSRVLAALPLDLAIGIVVPGFALLLGGGLGLVAGYWDRPRTVGGATSIIIMRLADIFLAFPSLVLALAIAASLGRGTLPSIIAVFATWWPYYVRLVRGEVLAIKHQPYVTAARAAGVSEVRILFRHVVRNLLEPITVYFTLDVGTVIIVFSTISFIGVGVPPEIPEWGNMTEFYQRFLPAHPWPVFAAGIAIFIAALAFSLLGDGLRDLLDPRSRRALTQVAAPSTLPAPAPEPGA
jgi:peptide/nickel transport system permease protein